MTTTERKQIDEKFDHIKAVIHAMEQCGPDQEVIVCPICRTWQTIRKGSDCECPTCSKIRGTEVR